MTGTLPELLAFARPKMAAFFANPPEGLSSGPRYHAHALEMMDHVIAGKASEAEARQATRQAQMWMGKIYGDKSEDDHAAHAEYDVWEHGMRRFPVPAYRG